MMPLSIDKLIHIPEIDLGEIYLRAVRYEDYADIYDYGKNDVVTKTLAWDSFKTIEEAQDAVKNVFLSRPDKTLPNAYAIVHKATEKMIGTCDFHRIEWDKGIGEIGYVLHHDFWRKGYMTLATKALIRFGFEYLKLNTIEIGHANHNIGSRRVIEKCGFHYVKTGIYKRLNQETKYYEMTKKDYQQLQMTNP
ncbi:MAG: GNAT family N-acetyltransferase [Candidatus Izimaplasma sp.]|nr:GNAT family N-acetyltransferase [Candidatus Izimaplasma bacterium]